MGRLTSAEVLVRFYRLWHGRLRFKGAGYLIRGLAPSTKSLWHYPLHLPEGHCINLDFRDISGASWLNHSLGDHLEETGLLKAMSGFISADTTIWDVGANCGIVSYMLARTTPARRIVFFEPIREVFSLACSALMPFPHTSGFNLALSATSGEAELVIPQRNSTTATLNPDSTERSGCLVQIECKRGDDMITAATAPIPNIIKIDTEGHESEVMKGLQGTVRKHRPVIFFEHISLTDTQVAEMIPEGYEIFSVAGLNGALTKGLDRGRGHNSALIPREP